MASTLQDLRKQAGYRTAKEFAEALEVPATTYSRYEQSPEKIPLSAAWNIADHLGCSIDAVVGREEVDVDSMRGDAQRYYDTLSEDSRDLTDMFMAMLRGRDNSRERWRRAREEDRHVQYARYYERLFLQSVNTDSELGDIVIFGSDDQRREAFREFVAARASANREKKVSEAVMERSVNLEIEYGFLGYDEQGHLGGTGLEDPEAREELAEEIDAFERRAKERFLREDRETIQMIMEAYDRIHGGPDKDYGALLKLINQPDSREGGDEKEA